MTAIRFCTDCIVLRKRLIEADITGLEVVPPGLHLILSNT